jgi:hypothetical protein
MIISAQAYLKAATIDACVTRGRLVMNVHLLYFSITTLFIIFVNMTRPVYLVQPCVSLLHGMNNLLHTDSARQYEKCAITIDRCFARVAHTVKIWSQNWSVHFHANRPQ